MQAVLLVDSCAGQLPYAREPKKHATTTAARLLLKPVLDVFVAFVKILYCSLQEWIGSRAPSDRKGSGIISVNRHRHQRANTSYTRSTHQGRVHKLPSMLHYFFIFEKNLKKHFRKKKKGSKKPRQTCKRGQLYLSLPPKRDDACNSRTTNNRLTTAAVYPVLQKNWCHSIVSWYI